MCYTLGRLITKNYGESNMKLQCCIIDGNLIVDYSDLNNIIAYIKSGGETKIELDLKLIDQISTLPQSELHSCDQQVISTYVSRILEWTKWEPFKKEYLPRCTITGDERAVQLFKTIYLKSGRNLENKQASEPMIQVSSNQSLHKAASEYLEKDNTSTLTRQQVDEIKVIIDQYQSHSWQAFFWNRICCGVFGKHYSQTIQVLYDLINNPSIYAGSVQIKASQIKDAISVESKYASHRLSLFNKPEQKDVQSGTDQVIYDIAMKIK